MKKLLSYKTLLGISVFLIVFAFVWCGSSLSNSSESVPSLVESSTKIRLPKESVSPPKVISLNNHSSEFLCRIPYIEEFENTIEINIGMIANSKRL